MILQLFLLLIATCSLSAEPLPETVQRKNIGLCITATGKYYQFVKPLIKTARKNFLTSHNVTYFVFTDGPIPEAPDIVKIEQKRIGWPYDTMLRFSFYSNAQASLQNMDYLFALDADMLIVGKVGSRILGDLVATKHPGYIDKRGTYETNPRSRAYVKPNEGKYYFCGGFWGGNKDMFLKTCKEIHRQIKKDMKNNIMPLWHDESHLNRYLIDHPPTKILSPEYCYPESRNIPYKKRIVALDKQHSLFQIP